MTGTTSRREALGLAVIVWTLLSGAVVLAELGGPVQAFAGGVFLLICPGAVSVVLTSGTNPIWRATMVGATSLVLDVLVSEVILHATGWSSRAAFVVLGWLSLAGAAALVASGRARVGVGAT